MLVLPTRPLVIRLLRLNPEVIDLMTDKNNVVEDIMTFGSSIRVIEEVRERHLESDKLQQFCKANGFAVALSIQVFSEISHCAFPKFGPVTVVMPLFHLTGCSHLLGGHLAEMSSVLFVGKHILDTKDRYKTAVGVDSCLLMIGVIRAVGLEGYDIETILGLSQQNLALLVGQVVGRVDVVVHLEVS